MLADYEGLITRLYSEQVAFLISERVRLDTEAAEQAAQEAQIARERAARYTTAAPAPNRGGDWASFSACVIAHESGGNPQAQNPHSSASGLYQDLTSTWNGYGGYARAADAPEAVQHQMNFELWQRAGAAPWAGSGC